MSYYVSYLSYLCLDLYFIASCLRVDVCVGVWMCVMGCGEGYIRYILMPLLYSRNGVHVQSVC